MNEKILSVERISPEGEGESTQLLLSADLQLPLEAATQVLGIFAQRGAGKSYSAAVYTEELVKHGLFVGYIDPLGIAWGLRSSANGEQPGYPVLILGGAHGDLPLDYNAGKIVAQFVMETRQPFILDLSLFDEQDQQCLFVADFLNGFRTSSEVLMHLIVDEADLFAPQMPETAQERRSLKAMNDLTRRYRSKGFGATLISQRPAVLHKNVLSMIDVLISLRVVSPQDVDALDKWIKRNATSTEREQFLATVSSLPNGTGWVWSPQWLKIFKTVSFRERETFNSSATPKVGVKQHPPKQLAEVDLTHISEQLTALIERANEQDPAILQARIKRLQEDLHREREGRTQKEERSLGPVSSIGDPQRVQDLLAQKSTLQEQVTILQEEVVKRGQEIEALQSVISPAQRLRAEKLQTANVNIEHAQIYRFYSGVAHQDAPGSLEEVLTQSPVVVSPLSDQIQEKAAFLPSQQAAFARMKSQLEKLAPNERSVLDFLLDHDGQDFNLQQLAQLMAIPYGTMRRWASETKRFRRLASLPFMAARKDGSSTWYKATFHHAFQGHDTNKVRHELGLDR